MESANNLPKLTGEISTETNSPNPKLTKSNVNPENIQTEEPESMRLGAHKFVLVARSPVFETMLEERWKMASVLSRLRTSQETYSNNLSGRNYIQFYSLSPNTCTIIVMFISCKISVQHAVIVLMF